MPSSPPAGNRVDGAGGRPYDCAGMIGLWIALGVAGLLVLVAIALYNRLVRYRNQIDNAWSQIDVQLRRRYDLIPNLVNTVKGYAAHEKQTFENVTAARAAGVAAKTVGEQAQAENMITQALRQLMAVVENYPELKANQNFLALQEELTGTEGRIAFARQFYNDQVLTYNNLVQQFPSSVIASMGGFSTREFFEIEEAATGPVQVQF